jgi:hypothetical protein
MDTFFQLKERSSRYQLLDQSHSIECSLRCHDLSIYHAGLQELIEVAYA